MIFGLLAYLLWGLFPAFFPLLLPAGPVEILAHRVLRHGDDAFARHLADIRSQVDEAADLSIIRVFDILVWKEEEQRWKRT